MVNKQPRQKHRPQQPPNSRNIRQPTPTKQQLQKPILLHIQEILRSQRNPMEKTQEILRQRKRNTSTTTHKTRPNHRGFRKNISPQTTGKRKNRLKTRRNLRAKDKRHRPRPKIHLPNHRQTRSTPKNQNRRTINTTSPKLHNKREQATQRPTIQRRRNQIRKRIPRSKKQTSQEIKRPVNPQNQTVRP